MPKLDNEQHERFCQEFIKDLNGSKAYARAYPGVTSGTARTNAAKLLANANISQRVMELQSRRAARTEVTSDMVVQRLANIAFGHMGLICVWTPHGLDLKPQEEMTTEELATIDTLDISPVGDGDGGLLGYKKRVKLKDSLKALELLSRHLGILDGEGAKKSNRESIQKRLLEAVAKFGAGSST